MNCWICGNSGTTGEHLAKASDLKAVFKGATQKKPLYFSTDSCRNIEIPSIKRSSPLKSSALICPYCNNVRTSPHDRAWEKLSEYLRKGNAALRKGSIIKLNRVFPGNTKHSMLNVHLYFVKLFGCAIVEHNIPINIAEFSTAIMENKAHPKIYLAFAQSLDFGLKRHVGRSNLEMASIGGKCMFATWFYVVDAVTVRIMYAEPEERRKGLANAWHPSAISKKVCIGEI